jgi:hypothetical protein
LRLPLRQHRQGLRQSQPKHRKADQQWRKRVTQTALAAAPDMSAITRHPLDRNQTIKGVVAFRALLILFATPLPPETRALISSQTKKKTTN